MVDIYLMYAAVLVRRSWEIEGDICLISARKHMLCYSLEAPGRVASDNFPQHMFSWWNNKKKKKQKQKNKQTKHCVATLSYLKLCLLINIIKRTLVVKGPLLLMLDH